jgi:hypothetical protein
MRACRRKEPVSFLPPFESLGRIQLDLCNDHLAPVFSQLSCWCVFAPTQTLFILQPAKLTSNAPRREHLVFPSHCVAVFICRLPQPAGRLSEAAQGRHSGAFVIQPLAIGRAPGFSVTGLWSILQTVLHRLSGKTCSIYEVRNATARVKSGAKPEGRVRSSRCGV